MIFLEESFSTLANVRSHGTASVWMATIVQQQTMFSSESFAAVTAIVGFGLWLRNNNGLLMLNLLKLLDWLLHDLHLLMCSLCVHLVSLLMLYLYLLLWWTLRLQRLLHHLTGGGDNLYLVNSRE